MTTLPATQRQYTLTTPATSSPAAPRRRELIYHPAAPTPSLPLSPTSVLLRIHAISLEARDLQILQNNYPAPHPILEDVVPVKAAAGEIVAVGTGVKEWKVGDRCIPIGMPGHYHQLDLEQDCLERSLGGGTHGVAQEYAVMDYQDIMPVAPHLSYEEAAALGSAPTAWACLFGHTPQLVPGSTVLVLGTGGVSLYAAQFALIAGASVILTSSSDDKLKQVVELLRPLVTADSSSDAIRTINYKTDTEWEKTVREMTGGRGVDCVIEVGGWGTVGKSVKATRKGGLVAVTGYLSTFGKVPEEIIQQDLSRMILYGACNVRGVFVGNKTQSEQMMRAVGRSGMKPVISKTFDFKDLPQAYEAMEASGHIGKIVVRL
ncbi:hypothetical protein IAT38_002147 [Cryptococcus sp. DSM 104549]